MAVRGAAMRVMVGPGRVRRRKAWSSRLSEGGRELCGWVWRGGARQGGSRQGAAWQGAVRDREIANSTVGAVGMGLVGQGQDGHVQSRHGSVWQEFGKERSPVREDGRLHYGGAWPGSVGRGAIGRGRAGRGKLRSCQQSTSRTRGERVGTSKLGPDDVRAVLGLHDVGAMRKDIAELFGIAGKSVERIVYLASRGSTSTRSGADDREEAQTE